jgi:hypothetical protein
MAKRPIDLKRDSAFSGTVGTDDEGVIQEFLNVGSSLLMIKDRAIYKSQLADQIDPGRTNINVPHTQQKIYSVGSSSEIVGRILLTAKYLFQHGMLDGRFNKADLMSAALGFFDEAIKLATLSDTLMADQDAAIAECKEQKAQGSVVLLPSITDIGGRVKSFIQHADHSMQRLLVLGRMFYSLPAGKAWFDGLAKIAAEVHQLEQAETQRLDRMAKFAQFLRNCRNCVEHPKHHQQVVFANFRMTPNAEIEPPTIEIVHEQTPEPVVPLTIFMDNMVQSVVNLGEQTMAFLASYHVMPGWKETVSVCYFPEGQRRHPHVRYYFAMNMNGQIVPIG